MCDAARRLHLLRCFERRQEHGPLRDLVPRLPHDLAKGVLYSHEARDAHRRREIRYVRQGYGGYAGTFDLTLRQSYGPAADRSGGGEHCHVDLFLPEVVDDRRDAF
jgi:hypothetical protein